MVNSSLVSLRLFKYLLFVLSWLEAAPASDNIFIPYDPTQPALKLLLVCVVLLGSLIFATTIILKIKVN